MCEHAHPKLTVSAHAGARIDSSAGFAVAALSISESASALHNAIRQPRNSHSRRDALPSCARSGTLDMNAIMQQGVHYAGNAEWSGAHYRARFFRPEWLLYIP